MTSVFLFPVTPPAFTPGLPFRAQETHSAPEAFRFVPRGTRSFLVSKRVILLCSPFVEPNGRTAIASFLASREALLYSARMRPKAEWALRAQKVARSVKEEKQERLNKTHQATGAVL